MLQQIAEASLWGTVIPLALVPRADLLALMREAAVIIQPSRFEGWSTVVQDAKALARPVICSALAVHLEQAPGALGFFDPDKPEELAAILATHWPALRSGGDESAENEALGREREFARAYGEGIWQTCREAAAIASQRRQNSSVAAATY
jgi:glycosyltransferase involved in cell wall biosynthesis